METTVAVQKANLEKLNLNELETYLADLGDNFSRYAKGVKLIRDHAYEKVKREHPILVDIKDAIDSRRLVDIAYKHGRFEQSFKRVLIRGIDQVYSNDSGWGVALEGDFGDYTDIHYFNLDYLDILLASKQDELSPNEQA